MQYWTCPLCGANLDRNEKCDCEEMAEREREEAENLLVKETTGQMAFRLEEDKGGKIQSA